MLKRKKIIIKLLVFTMCTSLVSTTISFAEDNTTVIPSTCNGVLITSIASNAFQFNTSIIDVEIPSSITSIGDSAFKNCNKLKSIKITDNVISIGDNAFAGCNSLTSITIPNNLSNIGKCTFSNCNSLTNITIPNSVTNISEYAFAGCSSLTSITIPNNVSSIGKSAFEKCNKGLFYVKSREVKQLLIDSGVDESKIILDDQSATIKVTAISINANNINWTVGKAETLTATVVPSNATNKGVTWKSSNTLVATADANGNITAVGAGSATITCTASDGGEVAGSTAITCTVNNGNIMPETKVVDASVQTTSNLVDSVLKSVSISGTEAVGHKLKTKVKYDGTEPKFHYQWQSASKKDGDYSYINGADEEEYKLKSTDKNKYIKVVITATINGQTYTVEDITSKIDRTTSDAEEDDNSSDNKINNFIMSTNTSTYNSSSPADGQFTNPSGHTISGWVSSNSKWYYLNNKGNAQTGWVEDKGKWYYLDKSKVMVSNTTIDGYKIGSDGTMIE